MDIYLPFPKYLFADCFDEYISTECKIKQALKRNAQYNNYAT